MNGRALLLVTLCAAASSAYSGEQPLVTKTNGPGYTLPAYVRFETCAVYLNRVVMTQTFGMPEELGFKKSEVRTITVDDSIQKVIAAAAKEELIKKDNLLCDAPSTTIQFYSGEEPLMLFTSGGCGSPRLDRNGPATLMLKDLVNQYCPTTHDYGGTR